MIRVQRKHWTWVRNTAGRGELRRNYDIYDRCELRRRNYDAPVMTLRRSLGLAVGFMKQCCRVLPQGRSGVQVHNSERARYRRQNKASRARISQADIRARCCSHLEAARDRPGTG